MFSVCNRWIYSAGFFVREEEIVESMISGNSPVNRNAMYCITHFLDQ